MKRLSKILAVLLTISALAGMLLVFATAKAPATATTLGFENDFESLDTGADFSSSFPSGTGSAGSYSTATVVDSGFGNKYLRYAYKAEMGEKAYRRDLTIGNYANTDSSSLTHLSDYSYFTVDFDLAADKYAYFVGYRVERKFSTSTLSNAESATVNIGGTDYAVSVTSTRAYTYTVRALYKTYDKFDEAVIAADIIATHNELMTELADVNAKVTGGSTYYTLTYTDDSKTAPATVRRDSYALSGLPVSDVDAYALEKGYAREADGALVSSVTVDDARASERLSYSDYTKFQLDARQVSGTTALNKTSGYVTHTVNLVYSGGEWQVRLDGSGADYYTGVNLSDKLGEWNHFTYAVKTVPKYNESTGKYTYGYSIVRLYINGEQVGEDQYISGSKYRGISDDIVPRGIDWQIERYATEYSMAMDNFVTTYYPVVEKDTSDPTKNKSYSSGDAVGIDDLFTADSGVTALYECTDVVYSADYEYPYPNGYAEIDGKRLFVPGAVNDALKNLKNGSVIVTTLDLYELDPPAWCALEIRCDPETEVTLSDAAAARGVSLKKTPTGYSISSGIKANMSLFTDMRFNLYLPVIEGVEITSVDGATLAEGTVRVGGTEMYVISATPDVESFEAIPVTVSYKNNEKADTYTAKLDPMSYATIVASTYECGSDEATLIYEMVKYKEAIATFLDPDFEDASGKLSAFKEIYAAHTDCGCVKTEVSISEEEKAVDYSALIEKGVRSVAYRLSLGEIGMAISVDDGVTVSRISYKNALGELITHTVEAGSLIKKDGYYLVTGVSAAYIDEIMTITVDGTEGTYCLGKYIINNPSVAVAKSIYTYAVAAEDYKNVTAAERIVSVGYLRDGAAIGGEYVLEGYFAGSGDEGAETLIKEALFKDVNSDKIISVQGITYGTDYDFGYEKGDLVRLTVTLKCAQDEHGSKTYAEFIPEKNPESIDETIISRGNALNYKLDEAVLVEDWADMQALFDIATLETYTYVHIKGHGYINYYSDKALYRPHMNADANALAGIKPDGSRALAFRGPMLNANVSDEAWAAYKSTVGHYPAKHNDCHEMDLDVYCVVTKVNVYNFLLTVLEDDWFVDHEHSYGDEWTTETPATLFEEGTEYRECSECSVREYRTAAIKSPEVLRIESAPIKTDYTVGETLDLDGLKLVAVTGDGKEYDVTELITVSKVILDTAPYEVTASYAGLTIPLGVKVNVPSITVSELKEKGERGMLYYVDAYVAGFAQDGPGGVIQVLLKDGTADDLISLVSAPEEAYSKGDRIRVYATLGESTSEHNPGKLLLTYSASNPEDVGETIVSQGNEITYRLDNVVTLSSFDEWRELFEVGKIDAYTFVKITEPLYASGYKSGTDNNYLARLHTLKDETTLANTKVDGKRYVSFRDTVMDLNIGTDWQNYFEGDITSTAIRALEFKSKEVIALYTGANSAYFQLTVLEDEWFTFEPENTEYSLADIVTEVAFAYVRRGKYIQYNQTMSRRHLNASPEEATAEHMIYLDCSSFVNAVYYEAFGVNVMPYDLDYKIDGVSQTPQTARFRNYARDNSDNPDAVGYWLMKGNADVNGALAEIMATLEAGDVINYRKGNDSSGHAMLYIGDGRFIHCTGDDFKDANGNDYPSSSDDSDASLSHDGATTAEKNNGAVRYETTYMDALFTDTSNARYLGAQYDVAIIRPIARGVTPTAESEARMALRELYIERSVDAGISTSVSRGETITYTLTLNNGAPYAREITVSELLSDSVSFVSASTGATLDGSLLTLSFRLGALKSASVSWTVRVNENAEAGALIESRSTTVNGITLSEVTNTVSAYTDTELAMLAEKALEYAESRRGFDDPALMVKALYKEALGVDVYDFDTALALLTDIIDVEKLGMNDESEVADIVAPYLYGGRDVGSMHIYNTDIIRLIRENNLSVGDAILAYDESESRTVAYVYVGDKTLVKITSDGKIAESVVITDSIYESSHVLVTLYAYDKYVVLRPSMR